MAYFCFSRERIKKMADETETETNAEQTEQRTDDYDGLARRIDDVMDAVRTITDAVAIIGNKIDALVNGMTADGDGEDDGGDDSSSEELSDVDLDTPIDELDFNL